MSTAKGKNSPVVSLYPERIECVNPATGQVIGEIPCVDMAEFPSLIEQARRAQVIWGETPFEKRRLHLFKIRDYLIQHAEEIAKVISISTGKTLSDAMNTEVLPSIFGADWYAKKAKKYLSKKMLTPSNVLVANKQTYILRVPLGVVGVISPWNYPFSIPFGEILMGLMAGNAVIYKPSEETGLVGQEIQKILAVGEFPPGLTCLVQGDPASISSSMLANRIDKLFFTGSVRVGKILMKQAAESLTPVALELGGNDAMIVMEDANLERAANGAVWGGFQNSGQTCAGIERVYVHENVAEDFLELVKEKTNKLRQGIDQGKFEIDVGSMTTQRQLQTVERHVKDAVEKGAKIFAQAKIKDKKGQNFYPATVLTNVNHEMLVMREETFGPVLGVMTFKTEAEALKLANDSDLGLTSSIWTMNNEKGRKLAEKLETGITTLNDHLMTHGMSEIPWVGWKNSGVGLTHSHLGLEEMTKIKVVNYDLTPNLNTNLWWFPHRQFKYDIFLETIHMIYGKTLRDKGESLMRLAPMILKDPQLKEKISYVLMRAQKRGGKGLRKTLNNIRGTNNK